VIGGFVNSSFRLRKTLAGKAKKARTVYRVDGVPFLVVVGVHDIFCSGDQFIDGLYGTELVLVDTGALGRHADGFFGVDRAHPDGRRRVISGVASLPGYSGGSVDSDVVIFHNPFADVRWPDGLVPAVRSWGIVNRSETSIQLGWTEPAAAESV
jgi:hypothetical protein